MEPSVPLKNITVSVITTSITNLIDGFLNDSKDNNWLPLKVSSLT